MSDASSVEAAAIESAYQERVRTLYTSLATNLGDSPGSERLAVEYFTKGLKLAQRARILALKVVGGEAPASVIQVASRKRGKAAAR